MATPRKSNNLRRLGPRASTVRSAPSISVAPGSVPETSNIVAADSARNASWFFPPLIVALGDRSPPETVKRSEEHTSELQSLMRISYAVFCLKKKTKQHTKTKS